MSSMEKFQGLVKSLQASESRQAEALAKTRERLSQLLRLIELADQMKLDLPKK